MSIKGILSLSLATLWVSARATQRPHILFVLADDYGWGGLGVHRQDGESPEEKQARAEVRTPNLDSLIGEGVLMNRYYSYKICSPARSALQSGRLPVHVNVLNTGVTVRNESDPVSGYAGIPRNMTGIAQKLKDSGYRTHMVGKWDAGMATPDHTPLGRGYESWLGYFQHANDYWMKGMPIQTTGEIDNCLNKFTDFSTYNASYRGGVIDGHEASESCKKNPHSDETCYEEHMFLQRGLQVIHQHDTSATDSPLFLFYAFHLLHTPLQVPQSYLKRIDSLVAKDGGKPIEDSNRRLLSAMILYMDEAVGQLVAALKAKQMWENTLMIFASDNGGAIYEPGSGNNHPLKGGKFSDWEGGVRANSFVSGGFIPSDRRGKVFDGVVSVADWYGTLCEVAGTDMTDRRAEAANNWLGERHLPLLKPVDSVPQWGFIMNNTNGRRDALHLSTQAVLKWPFKLVTGKQVYSTWQGVLYPNCTTVASLNSIKGPSFIDLKMFDQPIPVGKTQEEAYEVTWSRDCKNGCLLNVRDDPTEHHDLASNPQYASKLAELQTDLKRLNKGFFNPIRGRPVLQACEAAIKNGGFYGPFVDTDGFYSPRPRPSIAQRLKDAGTKELLSFTNRQIVENISLAVANHIGYLVGHEMDQRLDRCTKSFDGMPAVVV